MNTAQKSSLARIGLVATLAFAAVAAHANGITIGAADEHRISVGMTQSDVMNAFGRPAMKEKFMNEPGPTWTYEVPDEISQHTLFDVDFDADGKVVSVDERVVDIN